MPISLVTSQHWNKITNAFLDAKSEIKIISPFITAQPVKLLCDALNQNSKMSCTIITRFYREDFIKGVSSAEALMDLIKSGAEVYALNGLHTKLYLFDKEVAFVGSANLTSGGLRLNHELSLLVECEELLFEELNVHFDVSLNNILSQGDYKISLEKIETEIAFVQRCRQNLRQRGVEHKPNGYKFGADIVDAPSSLDGTENQSDPIQDIISKKPINVIEEGIWLKFVGEANDRYNSSEKFTPTFISETGETITNFPQKPSGIKANAHIFIAALTTDKNGRNTPVVVARARTFGYDDKNIANETMVREHPWMSDYPYYITLFELEYLKCEVQNGISLIDILAEVGSSTYPNSKGTAKTLAELSVVHHQKDKLHITEECKEYLDSRFEKLASLHGIGKVISESNLTFSGSCQNSSMYMVSNDALEKKLYDELIQNAKECKKLGYNPMDFLEMLHQLGVLGTARKLINAPTVSSGYSKLFELGRLDLTLEAVMLKPDYSELLTADELKICENRLS